MGDNFFDNYKKFVVLPSKNELADKEGFHPEDYNEHFIVTLSLYDPLISCWREASKYEIEIRKSLERTIKQFNKKEQGACHLQILELEEDASYFVLALSRQETTEIENKMQYLLEKMFINPLYNEECWYRLIGEKGKIKRQLLCFTYKKYVT